MRKLIVWTLMTLDGYFEGEEKWDLDFHSLAWGDDLENFILEQTREVGTLLFGRVTYEGMAAHWKNAAGEVADFMNTAEKFVASNRLKETTWANSRILPGTLADSIDTLKQENGKDIFVFGSAELTAALLRYGLVDEFRLGIVPVILGAGTPLFRSENMQQQMKLKKHSRLIPARLFNFTNLCMLQRLQRKG